MEELTPMEELRYCMETLRDAKNRGEWKGAEISAEQYGAMIDGVHDRFLDLVDELLPEMFATIDRQAKEIESWNRYASGINDALNSGDGVYRP